MLDEKDKSTIAELVKKTLSETLASQEVVSALGKQLNIDGSIEAAVNKSVNPAITRTLKKFEAEQQKVSAETLTTFATEHGLKKADGNNDNPPGGTGDNIADHPAFKKLQAENATIREEQVKQKQAAVDATTLARNEKRDSLLRKAAGEQKVVAKGVDLLVSHLAPRVQFDEEEKKHFVPFDDGGIEKRRSIEEEVERYVKESPFLQAAANKGGAGSGEGDAGGGAGGNGKFDPATQDITQMSQEQIDKLAADGQLPGGLKDVYDDKF